MNEEVQRKRKSNCRKQGIAPERINKMEFTTLLATLVP
jgi:hypothetical protein